MKTGSRRFFLSPSHVPEFYNRCVMPKAPLPFFILACLIGTLSGGEGREKSAGDAQSESLPKAAHAASNESETTPQLAPKPDSTFANALDWNDGAAEILAYSVKRNGKGGESVGEGRLVTERMISHSDGSADRKAAGKGDTEILNALLMNFGEENGAFFSSQTTVKLARHDRLRLLRQDQSLQAWPGTSYRSLDCRVTPPRLRIFSSGGEAPKDTLIARWPVYTEAMLFTYLRSVPLRVGYREELWFQDWAGEGRFVAGPQFASITVHSKTTSIRDMDTWYITMDREDGRRAEFWISSTGLHPVVLAVMGDRSEWTLKGISRKKYWSW